MPLKSGAIRLAIEGVSWLYDVALAPSLVYNNHSNDNLPIVKALPDVLCDVGGEATKCY